MFRAAFFYAHLSQTLIIAIITNSPVIACTKQNLANSTIHRNIAI